AGMAASSGGGGSVKGPVVQDFTPRENRYNKAIQSILGENRNVTEGAVGLQGMLTPDQLRALGYDVEYTDNTANIQAAAAAAQAKQDRISQIEARLAEIKQGLQSTKASGKRTTGKANRKAAKREKKQLQIEQKFAQN